MSTQDSDQLGNADEVSVALGPVVRGGRLKKPWAPELALDDNGAPLMHQGNYFIALSGNDYGLAQFLFGKANSNGRRNLPQTNLVRRLWKARIALQKEAEDQILAQRNQEIAGEEEILGGIFGSDSPANVNAALGPRPALESLPRFFRMVLGSGQEDKGSVTFVIPRAKNKCVPCVELTAEVLQNLLGEIEADGLWQAESSVGSPSTPLRRRRSSPLVRSPGASPQARAKSQRSRKKKKLNSTKKGIHHDKKANRVLANWRKRDGSQGRKSFPIKTPGMTEEVLTMARKHVADHHCASTEAD